VALPGGVSLALDLWEGGGTGFLLVHGLASNARMWDGVAGRLAEAGHAVAAVDLRGHGRSDKAGGGYDFATVCGDLEAVIGALAWDHPPVVVGQSWGGNVVLELAFRSPDILSGVACVDGGTIELAGRFATWEECAAALAPPVLVGTAAGRFEAAIRAAHPDWPESGIQGTLANFEVRPDGTIAPWLSLEHHMAILRALYEHRPSTRYPELTVPVLLVPADTKDPAWTADKRDAVAAAEAAIPVARVVWFSPADHDIHAQFPDALAALLQGAVSEGFFK
jgi:pimeloyl-ACP methyl ester carboxylesterase